MKTPHKIVMMEDHDEAYRAWKALGVHAKTLVHVDAHIDFGWVPELDLNEIGSGGPGSIDSRQGDLLLNPFLKSRKKMVHIGNYICPAMRDGIVNKFIWVVPDASLKTARGLRHIKKQLNRLLKIKKYAGGKPEFRENRIRCRLHDREVIVCGLECLERIDEPVLLDIDVDFMLTPYLWDDLDPRRVPWIFPEELFEKLGQEISDIDVLTIAYSVEGGFTPLRFKYLGDELRFLFKGASSGGRKEVSCLKRRALAFEKENKGREASVAYEEALRIDDADASLYFNLFLYHLGRGPEGREKAAHFYQEALLRDRSYGTRYNNYGILYLLYNRPKKAELEYKRFLRLDENNADVLNGLGHIALAGRRYAEARAFFDRCLALDKNHPDARLGKGIVGFREGRLREAEELFSELKKDQPDDAAAFWWLGRTAQRRGDSTSAIENYKDGVMRGGEGPFVHLVLARLYLRKGFYFRAFEELRRFFQAMRIES